MDTSELLERTSGDKVLINDSNYYRYIFKKTEKIVCAVFYVLHSHKDIHRDDLIIKDLERTAQKLMDIALLSLRTGAEESEASARTIGFMLIELESKLRILNASRMLPQDLLQVFLSEIDAVLRSLRSYQNSGFKNPLFGEDRALEARAERRQKTTPVLREANARASSPQQGEAPVDRRSRILAILRDKGQASIKDVSEAVKDCSEKTIQRELNTLIKDGIVHREGERRWSRYSIA